LRSCHLLRFRGHFSPPSINQNLSTHTESSFINKWSRLIGIKVLPGEQPTTTRAAHTTVLECPLSKV
jgi:hypothetical protein